MGGISLVPWFGGCLAVLREVVAVGAVAVEGWGGGGGVGAWVSRGGVVRGLLAAGVAGRRGGVGEAVVLLDVG